MVWLCWPLRVFVCAMTMRRPRVARAGVVTRPCTTPWREAPVSAYHSSTDQLCGQIAQGTALPKPTNVQCEHVIDTCPLMTQMTPENAVQHTRGAVVVTSYKKRSKCAQGAVRFVRLERES